MMVLVSRVFGRCLGHEGGAFRNGINALLKGLRKDFPMCGQSKMELAGDQAGALRLDLQPPEL